MQNFVYVGCFFDYDELKQKIEALGKKRLDKTIMNPHITFEYRPESVNTKLFGEKIRARIIAYGNNGENEGVKVEIYSDNPMLCEMASNIAVPHITLSISENGKAVNTRYLDFTPIEPFEIVGKYGGFTKDKTVVTE